VADDNHALTQRVLKLFFALEDKVAAR